MLISTFAATQQQVVLVALFTALPLMMRSGAFAPIQSVPAVWQTHSLMRLR